jgi:hypothetical protein
MVKKLRRHRLQRNTINNIKWSPKKKVEKNTQTKTAEATQQIKTNPVQQTVTQEFIQQTKKVDTQTTTPIVNEERKSVVLVIVPGKTRQ